MPDQPRHIHQIVEIHPGDVLPDRLDRLFPETRIALQRVQKRARFDLQQVIPVVDDNAVLLRHLQRRGSQFTHLLFRRSVLRVFQISANFRKCSRGQQQSRVTRRRRQLRIVTPCSGGNRRIRRHRFQHQIIERNRRGQNNPQRMRARLERQTHQPFPVDIARFGRKHHSAAHRFPVQAEFRVNCDVATERGGIAAQLILPFPLNPEDKEKFTLLLAGTQSMPVGKTRISDRFKLRRIKFRTGTLQENSLQWHLRQRIIADPAGVNFHFCMFHARLNCAGQSRIRLFQIKTQFRKQFSGRIQDPPVGTGAVSRKPERIAHPGFPAQFGIVPYRHDRQLVLCVIFAVFHQCQFNKMRGFLRCWTLRKLKIPAVFPVRRADPEAAELVRIRGTGIRCHRDFRLYRHRLFRREISQRHQCLTVQRPGESQRRRHQRRQHNSNHQKMFHFLLFPVIQSPR